MRFKCFKSRPLTAGNGGLSCNNHDLVLSRINSDDAVDDSLLQIRYEMYSTICDVVAGLLAAVRRVESMDSAVS